MTGYEKLKILCDTTFDEYPTASIEIWVRELVSEYEVLLNKPDSLSENFAANALYEECPD